MAIAESVLRVPDSFWSSVLLGSAILALYLWSKLSSLQLDPQEPPVLKPKVPFIGHIIGLLYHAGEYYNVL